MQSAFISVAIGYLLGSIPSGFLVAKCRGIDIRQHGSGNIGATNVVRTLGRSWGSLVFFFDVLKGIIAVQLAMKGLACGGPACSLPADQLGIIAGLGCFLGHCFPVWLGFKGGKGVATGAGILIGLTPLTAVIGLTIWGIVYYTSRYVSLASIVAAISLPMIFWFLQRQLSAVFWFIVVISALAIWRHRTNIQRLLAGTESRFEKKK
jgi:glycerol-3-phosphate acyltransferase PlsY